MRIADRMVGGTEPPFIIAEMSGNHNQSLERALEIVEAAAHAGAHGLKLQTYTADSLTLPVKTGDFFIDDPSSPWYGQSLYDLYQVAQTPWEWHLPIFKRAQELGLIAFSTPFDETAVDFLEELDVPCYKIASFENADLPLIRKVAATGKPMIISTGMATVAELDETVRTAREHGCSDIALLKCTSSYPASPVDINLRAISHMRELFDCEVGLSDHTLGVGVAVAAVAQGATLVEKHFTMRRSDGGVDSMFSLEPEEMRVLVDETKRAWQALGKVKYGAVEVERKSMRFRRSIYVASDIKAGDVLSEENVRIVRPGFGMAPKYYEMILGRKAKCDLAVGDPLTWDRLL